MYQASYDSYNTRKAENFVPVATSDTETLAEIQANIARKRPKQANKQQKKPVYCAGQTASVSPLMENRCSGAANGVTKADQAASVRMAVLGVY